MNLRNELNLFLIAITFFTRIPLTRWVVFNESYLNQAARYFSWVGWVVGAISAILLWFFVSLLPIPLAVVLAMAITLVLTGAFHEDGWADSCDGFGGGWTKEQVLHIMKDSRLGTYGMVGLVFMLAIKAIALILLAQHSILAACYTLLFAHVASRYVSTTLMRSMLYVQDIDQSKVKPLATQLDDESFTVATMALVPLVVVMPFKMLVILLAALLIVRQLCQFYFERRLGGYTGDCLGAAQQLSEITVYLVFCSFL